MYGVYHGPSGLKDIALRIHLMTKVLEHELIEMGYSQHNDNYFDTLLLTVSTQSDIRSHAEESHINFRYIGENQIGISIDETTQIEDLQLILLIFAEAKHIEYGEKDLSQLADSLKLSYPDALTRKSDFLTHPVFTGYHSETQMLRYIKNLEKKDLSLTTSMISLGSCTMKLNAAVEMLPVSWQEFSDLHPFVPIEQAKGYRKLIKELEGYLCEVTGLNACSLQPNSGAQGEYTGLMVIRAYYHEQGNKDRDLILIPSSAHGTNPASAISAGMRLIIVQCDESGNIDVADLKEKAESNKKQLAGLMVTYPSTHGVFEESIKEICDIIHKNGGQVYMDGANMNAQVGLTSPGIIGVDVCHLNLHKTFSIPHGGGGPGLGPICVAEHLAPYLPGHPVIDTGGERSIPAVASAPWSSASIMVISYAYIRLLGSKGCTDVSKYAILNANYIKSRLAPHYSILYQGNNGRVAHEFNFRLPPLQTNW